MITILCYRFEALEIDFSELNRQLGFSDQELPPPFDAYVEKAINDCKGFKDYKGTLRIKPCAVKKGSFSIDEVVFKPGKTICSELSGAEQIALFIATAGKSISHRISHYRAEDPVLGYVYDALGSLIVEAIGDKIASFATEQSKEKGFKVTNRYSPGYCQWNVNEQHKLFDFFNGKTGGVTLSESALMSPIKSISGVMGIGKAVKYRAHSCELCDLTTCALRKEGAVGD